MSITFSIVMPTYFRQNGTTYNKITRAINSIKKQTYNNWKLFLIGDHYENDEEFIKISNLLPNNKITAINLPFAVEREDQRFTGHNLWCSAGANASNVGIEASRKENIYTHCHLDDDDEWLPYHLETLNMAYNSLPESVFVYTNALYTDRNKHTMVFPNEVVSPYLYYNNLPPRPEKLIHSTASWKLDKIPFKHRNTFEQDRIFPGDADMWERINNFCVDKNYKTLYVPITTVIKHDEAEILN